jgi:homoaconitase/3-isopropylmalate dehydratase large subunit
MPLIKSLVSKHLAHYSKLVAVILSFSEIMPTYFCYIEKGLIYIIITALFSWQPSSCSKCTKLNIYSSYNVYSISNTKCIYLAAYLCTL